ncbi:MAG: alanine--glyoxylate aminotransferase family protein [Candidatus Bipolaricaulota bacterium]|nr:alanine--glyoxylate aminotransferase family protein [Candidatus Bipolaricaulota bacterium]
MTVKRYRLRIPGPIDLEPEVLSFMSAPLIAHYGHDWVEIYTETVTLLKQVWQTKEASVFLMPGPGSVGMEAAIASLSGDTHQLLVLTNGFFGDRWVTIARAYSSRVSVLESTWGRAFDVDAVEQALKRDREIKVVIMVHGETSTGVLNPLREIGALCERYGAVLVADMVATLGGTEIAFDDWQIGIGVSATQKCLECPPGLAPVAVSPRAWEAIERSKGPGWFVNLRTWQHFAREWADWHPHPVTMPTGLTQALRFSLHNILEEGLSQRWARHWEIAALVRNALKNLGFELFVPDDREAMNTVTAAKGHPKLPAAALIHALKEKHQILIGGGLEKLAGQIFRIGHMGPTATRDAIVPTLLAIEDVLRSVGIAVEPGQGLRAPMPVMGS